MRQIEEEIIIGINQGDTRAFEELYTTFYSYLCAVATKFIYDPAVAQEIVNDVFLNVWKNRETLVYPVNTYLIRAVRNRCLNHLQRKREDNVSLTDVQEQLLSIQEGFILKENEPLKELEHREFETIVLEAVHSLPDKCRDIFIQYLYQDKTYEEIAVEKQIAASTVRGQVRIALQKLRVQLKDKFICLFLYF